MVRWACHVAPFVGGQGFPGLAGFIHNYHPNRYRAFGRQETCKVQGLVRDAGLRSKREYIGHE